MPTVKEKKVDTLGTKVAALRKARGVTQQRLADAVGVSRRVIAYYEIQASRIPGDLLARIAEEFNTSLDDLLEVETSKMDGRSADGRFFRKWEKLSEDDRKAVTQVVDAILTKQE